VAKFHGDRPSELGDLVANLRKEKTSAVKHKAFRSYRSGRPNYECVTICKWQMVRRLQPEMRRKRLAGDRVFLTCSSTQNTRFYSQVSQS